LSGSRRRSNSTAPGRRGSPSLQIIAETGNADVAERLPCLIVRCVDSKIEAADAARQLWLATLEIVVLTPRQAIEWTEADHRALVAAAREQIVPAHLAAIAGALGPFGIADCNRWFFAGAPDEHTKGHWVTLLRYDPFAFSVTV